MFVHRPRAEAEPADVFWDRVRAHLDARPAVQCAFVQAVATGDAPIESVRHFARDLFKIAHELPLIEGEIASRAALHGVETVIWLSHGATLAFGYQHHEPLVDLVDRFAEAVGVDRADGIGASLPAEAFLVCVRSLGLEWFEAGVAATMVDEQWRAAAAALAEGLGKHYGLNRDELACFDALASFDGPRTTERPKLLREIAVSGYHQHVVGEAAREVVTVWNNLWDAWTPGRVPLRLE